MCKQKAISKTLKKDIKVYVEKNRNDVRELRMAKDTISVRESTIGTLEQDIAQMKVRHDRELIDVVAQFKEAQR